MSESPVTDYADLRTLADSAGWRVFNAEYAQRFAELTARVLDVKTDGVEAEHLRQARGRIEQEFHPATILDQLLKKTGAAAARETSAAGGSGRNPDSGRSVI